MILRKTLQNTPVPPSNDTSHNKLPQPSCNLFEKDGFFLKKKKNEAKENPPDPQQALSSAQACPAGQHCETPGGAQPRATPRASRQHCAPTGQQTGCVTPHRTALVSEQTAGPTSEQIKRQQEKKKKKKNKRKKNHDKQRKRATPEIKNFNRQSD
jgi:hypothetical protein